MKKSPQNIVHDIFQTLNILKQFDGILADSGSSSSA